MARLHPIALALLALLTCSAGPEVARADVRPAAFQVRLQLQSSCRVSMLAPDDTNIDTEPAAPRPLAIHCSRQTPFALRSHQQPALRYAATGTGMGRAIHTPWLVPGGATALPLHVDY